MANILYYAKNQFLSIKTRSSSRISIFFCFFRTRNQYSPLIRTVTNLTQLKFCPDCVRFVTVRISGHKLYYRKQKVINMLVVKKMEIEWCFDDTNTCSSFCQFIVSGLPLQFFTYYLFITN
jgi:hypothetical protein